MTNTAKIAPPPTPAWASSRNDVDTGTPDAWYQFNAPLGTLEVLDGDTYCREDAVTLEGRAISIPTGDLPAMAPMIEVTSLNYHNVVFGLTPADARALAALLAAAADRLEGVR